MDLFSIQINLFDGGAEIRKPFDGRDHPSVFLFQLLQISYFLSSFSPPGPPALGMTNVSSRNFGH
jgi:hypothetical protein